MVMYESNCSGCYDSDSFCVGFCPNKSFPVLYCDKCKCPTENLYRYDGGQICEDCLKAETLLTDMELGI